MWIFYQQKRCTPLVFGRPLISLMPYREIWNLPYNGLSVGTANQAEHLRIVNQLPRNLSVYRIDPTTP